MRLVIVSNRLPIVIEQRGGEFHTRRGSGGLITAMAPVLRRWGGLWIGWPGAADQPGLDLDATLAEFGPTVGCEFRAVRLTEQDRDDFYNGFSNQIIWPLFHDLQTWCNFDPAFWRSYLAVNRKFADVIAAEARPGDFLWVHDYHLMSVGAELRARGLQQKLGFFLHIPFPPPDIFFKLPWRSAVLEGLLSYDLVGFQTPRDQENFAHCARALLPDARVRRRAGGLTVEHHGRQVQAGAFPISIDYNDFAARAADPQVTELVQAIRAELPDRQIILGLDRLDYTKGIPDRLRAFRTALERHPSLHRAVTFVQVVVPSRGSVEQYKELRAEIEQLVGSINGQFTQPGWVPIHHNFRSLAPDELLAYYRTADVALVTPLKDGMNLVAKEYCASQLDGDGALILSEFAGAAAELSRDALIVNPYDVEGVADAIHRGATMTRQERRRRMRRLRSLIAKRDIYAWVHAFLSEAGMQMPETRPAGDVARSAAVPLGVEMVAEDPADIEPDHDAYLRRQHTPHTPPMMSGRPRQ